MSKSISLTNKLLQLAMKFASQLFAISSVFLLLLSSLSFGAEDDSYRILVLRGNWHERDWDKDFNRYFLESMAASKGNKVQVSFQNLGLDKLVSPTTREFYVENIRAIIDEQGVDILVAVLPTAIEFVLEIESIAEVPKVLVLPAENFDQSSLPQNLVRVVQSQSNTAIRKTIESIESLHPSTRVIEVFSGSGQTDLSYVSRVKAISVEYLDRFDFRFNTGLLPDELASNLASLDDGSVVLITPYMANRGGEFRNSVNFLPELSKLSSVPLYSFVDGWLGHGIVGGHMHTVDNYAYAAGAAASSLINQTSPELVVLGGFRFDYTQSKRWNLNLADLSEPYVVDNKPRSILDDYVGFIYTIALLVLLLLAVLCLQFLLLKRSKIANVQLEASEKKARENEVRFELLTGNSLDLIWTWDGANNRTTYCSPSVRQLTGYTFDELLALPRRSIMTSASVKLALAKLSSTSRGAQLFEVELVKKNGDKISCEIAAQPVSDSADNSAIWVGVTRDISKRKEVEKERLALQNQVRQAQKFESLGTLAGGIAHDFNNILGILMGLTELLKLKISGNGEAELIADKLMKTTDRAKMLVGQILAFSRQSSDLREVTNLNALLLESFQIMQTGMPKSISLSFSDNETNVNVRADSNQLSQVFINALTNAYEAIDEYEGKISLSASVLKLSETTKFLHGELACGCYALIKVVDNGEGLTEDEIEKMFDPFYTSKDLGNGMGLAIARGIVIGHGGAIDIESTLGLGTTVSIVVPIVESDAELIELSKAVNTDTAKSTIVLVDDQEDLLETVAFMLKELGHKCIPCVDPKIALDVIGNPNLEIDLVITDYSMPGISGLDIRKFSAKHRPNVPVVLATGYSERIAQDQLLSKQPHYILNKPFGFRELKEILNTALTEH
jgi:PAS domain S-box-containing protein